MKVAEALDIGAYLRLGRGEEISGGREKKTLLVNAFEALVAAVYLDGGIEAACQLVGGTVLTVTALDGAVENLALDNNKSALQELLQASQLPPPVYEPVGEVGAPHSKVLRSKSASGSFSRPEVKAPPKIRRTTSCRTGARIFPKPSAPENH